MSNVLTPIFDDLLRRYPEVEADRIAPRPTDAHQPDQDGTAAEDA